MSDAVFDRLTRAAVPALLDGTHGRDEPPVDGGRWPVSVVCLPDERTRHLLTDLWGQARAHAGPGHFATGRGAASHFTVRVLEPYREAAAPDDDVTGEWVAALEVAARQSPPVRLRLSGVALSTGCVMTRTEPVDDAGWGLMRRLRSALGPLAWYEDAWQERDIWYASLLHYAAPVLDAPGLVAWAHARRASEPVEVVLDTVSLVRARYREEDGERHMALEPWRTVPLGGGDSAGPQSSGASIFSPSPRSTKQMTLSESDGLAGSSRARVQS